MIDPEALRRLLSYNPETGEIHWKVSHGRGRAGKKTGGQSKRGCLVIGIDGKIVKAHRIAWALHYGEWPAGYVDHINCDKTDNRIANLRLATHAENIRNRRAHSNNKSGYKGVYWHPVAGKWVSQIKVDKKTHHLGCYDTPQEAHAAYVRACNELHGEFARVA